MLKCDYCPKEFIENENGLLMLVFHESLHEPETVNGKLPKGYSYSMLKSDTK